MSKVRKFKNLKGGLRLVSVFEAVKGLIVLLTGFGLLLLIHKDLHLFAEQLVRHLHFNPARHYPQIFIDTINNITNWQLWALAISALIYSLARFFEAYGLWFQKQWAEWFGFLTGGIYIPVELYENIRGVTWPKLIILIVNIFIVAYLGSALYESRKDANQG
jgi:uncharacterized membrane protein (DUF2068 family)